MKLCPRLGANLVGQIVDNSVCKAWVGAAEGVVDGQDVVRWQPTLDVVPWQIKGAHHAGREMQAVAAAEGFQHAAIVAVMYQKGIEGAADCVLNRLSPPGGIPGCQPSHAQT